MRLYSLLAAGVVATTLLAACGGGGDAAPKAPNSAEEALKQQFDFLNQGQWGPEWDILHPAQQLIVSRDHYIECGSKLNLPHVDAVEIVQTYSESVTIPGTSLTADSTAVIVRLNLSRGTLQNTEQGTYHEFYVDGAWRWNLPNPADYADGKCPTTTG